ncbi:MAG: hypothetical protein AB4080_25645 [Trichodesmium sp.]
MDKSSTSTGFIAGILLTLFFSISFNLLGYTNRSSIILGIIGGIAGGLLGFWSQIESRPEIPEKTDVEPVDTPEPEKPEKPRKTWPITPKERSGVSILSWFLRPSEISSRSKKKY